jgi:hypothetical protein
MCFCIARRSWYVFCDAQALIDGAPGGYQPLNTSIAKLAGSQVSSMLLAPQDERTADLGEQQSTALWCVGTF